MGEKQILTDEMIDEKLDKPRKEKIIIIDPMQMDQWTLETASAVYDHAVSTKTIERAIAAGELDAYKVGKKVTVEREKFRTWYKRFKK